MRVYKELTNTIRFKETIYIKSSRNKYILWWDPYRHIKMAAMNVLRIYACDYSFPNKGQESFSCGQMPTQIFVAQGHEFA